MLLLEGVLGHRLLMTAFGHERWIWKTKVNYFSFLKADGYLLGASLSIRATVSNPSHSQFLPFWSSPQEIGGGARRERLWDSLSGLRIWAQFIHVLTQVVSPSLAIPRALGRWGMLIQNVHVPSEAMRSLGLHPAHPWHTASHHRPLLFWHWVLPASGSEKTLGKIVPPGIYLVKLGKCSEATEGIALCAPAESCHPPYYSLSTNWICPGPRGCGWQLTRVRTRARLSCSPRCLHTAP